MLQNQVQIISRHCQQLVHDRLRQSWVRGSNTLRHPLVIVVILGPLLQELRLLALFFCSQEVLHALGSACLHHYVCTETWLMLSNIHVSQMGNLGFKVYQHDALRHGLQHNLISTLTCACPMSHKWLPTPDCKILLVDWCENNLSVLLRFQQIHNSFSLCCKVAENEMLPATLLGISQKTPFECD